MIEASEEVEASTLDQNGNVAREIYPKGSFEPGTGRFRKGRATQTPKLRNTTADVKLTEKVEDKSRNVENNPEELLQTIISELETGPTCKDEPQIWNEDQLSMLKDLETALTNENQAPQAGTKGTLRIVSEVTLEPENRIRWKEWKQKQAERKDVDLEMPWKLTRFTMPENTYQEKEEYVRKLKQILNLPRALRRARMNAVATPRIELLPFVPIPTPIYIKEYDVTDPLGLKRL